MAKSKRNKARRRTAEIQPDGHTKDGSAWFWFEKEKGREKRYLIYNEELTVWLTGEQYAEYERELTRLHRSFPAWRGDQLNTRALNETLYRARPSIKCQELFHSLFERMNAAGLIISEMKNSQLTTADPKLRVIATQVLAYARDELESVLKKLSMIHSEISLENDRDLKGKFRSPFNLQSTEARS